MKFEITKHPHISLRHYVWKNKICIGYVETSVKERDDIDHLWKLAKQDRSFRFSVNDRWQSTYTAYAFPINQNCGTYKNINAASNAILEKQEEIFNLYQKMSI